MRPEFNNTAHIHLPVGTDASAAQAWVSEVRGLWTEHAEAEEQDPYHQEHSRGGGPSSEEQAVPKELRELHYVFVYADLVVVDKCGEGMELR